MNLKTLVLIVATLLVSNISQSILHAAPPADRAKAKIVIMKTNRAVGIAHMTVKRTKKYSGYLSKAVKHARFAKKLFMTGNFERSIQHSLFARKMAAEVLKDNNAKTTSDYLYSPEENTFIASMPSEEKLTEELIAENSTELTDELLMNGNLDVEVQ